MDELSLSFTLFCLIREQEDDVEGADGETWVLLPDSEDSEIDSHWIQIGRTEVTKSTS